ncbi:hypothetical protein P175DRAFT_0492017 [Aspergillus ochraceoroseus IBT 24754]|uniref:Uncharacterized protein n=1 Tax=Aspergillus ochraceoroseus IBT 24754 TaxID=1392256 RepID=A0A2T5LYI0_9EURO|nr:uncharacterized protein P175DRAFT_0492017 [Aspergillus ochraceoroseus IBT 24754]PTU21340.1 hypothetical protein P175DRAFT_0492017 [Aspergillus ochraceoroseus IBT 24754]
MKFTGIVSTLAIAGAASAALIPNLQVVKIQSTITRLDSVLGTVEGLVGTTTNTVSQAALTSVKSDLSGIHNKLENLVGGLVTGVVSNGVVQEVTSIAEETASSVVSTLGGVTEVSSLTSLAESLVSRVQSGAVDATGLESVLSVLGQTSGLQVLNGVLSQA